jgi:EAL domain-containing protein (putative c-di-GMP-specific phosphodiesterase class I)/GGDEF domain-containing protein
LKKLIFKFSLIFLAVLLSVITVSAIYYVYIDISIKEKYSSLHDLSLDKSVSEMSSALNKPFEDLESYEGLLKDEYYAFGQAVQTEDGYQMSLKTKTAIIQQPVRKEFYDRLCYAPKSVLKTEDGQFLVFSIKKESVCDLLLIEYDKYIEQFNYYHLDNIMLIDKNGLIVFSLLELEESNIYRLLPYAKLGKIGDNKSQFENFHDNENYLVIKKSGLEDFYVAGYADVQDMNRIIKEDRERNLFFVLALASASFLGAYLIALIYIINNNRNLTGKFVRGKYSIFVDKRGKILFKNQKFAKDFKLNEIVSYTLEENKKIRDALLNNGDITLKLKDKKGQKRYLRFMTARALNGFRMLGTDVTEIMKDYFHAKHLANCNNLSGLPNTVQLRKDYENIRRERPEDLCCVALLEIRGTERYKTMFGDKFYKKLIRAFSERIDNIFKGMVYHSGDDKYIIFTHNEEFSILLTQNRSKYLAILESPFVIDKNHIKLNYKIGISKTFYPSERLDLSQPIKQAKQIYFSIRKAPNRTTGVFYDALMKNELYLYEEKEAIMELIENGELELYFQPQYSLKTDRIVGFEGLLRIKKKINISISEFIELAERNGSIIDVGNFVYQMAMEFAKKMQDKDVSVSWNISPVQLMQEGFVENFLSYYRKNDLKQGSVAIELTESVLISSYESVITKLNLLRKEGINVHLDDFGIEYSSMLYLKKLPINAIKIDKSFIDDIDTNSDSAVIVEALIELAKKLNLRCIAEGVETNEQLEELKRLNCDIIQGYSISKALPVDKAIEIYNKYNKDK